jgi:ribosomal protein S18 acetylase RimI-like enzyme
MSVAKPSSELQLTLRRGELRDAPTIAVYMMRLAWETEEMRLNPSAVERGVKAALVDHNKGEYFVAECGGSVVGCLMLTREWSDWRDGWILWIQSVYVHADFRRKGVFKSLYAHVRDYAIEKGALSIRLYVDMENKDAQDAYVKLGMTLSNYRVVEGPVE